MITDRTMNDVIEAKKIRSSIIQNYWIGTLTPEQWDTVEKGLITLNALNRIESKQNELKNILYSMGYASSGVTNKTWSHGMYFTESDLNRFCENTAKLRNAFYVLPNTPENPEARFYFEEFNKMEKILVDIETMIPDVISHYRECDTFWCGEEQQNI